MPLRMVSATLLPARTAPANSKMTARAHACLMVSALEPTEVAYALATSLAPMPNAAKMAAMAPKTTIHEYLRGGGNARHALDDRVESGVGHGRRRFKPATGRIGRTSAPQSESAVSEGARRDRHWLAGVAQAQQDDGLRT
eukprot:scaffold25066_cov106-Isochrysis_galbana.AAC.1